MDGRHASVDVPCSWFEPQDLSNFEGKRIRNAGAVWQKVIEALGASPVPVPPAETADAMGKGIVDGATFPFEATIPFDLAPVSEYTLTPGIAGATFSVIIGDHAYLRLSDEHKALIDETTGPGRAADFGALWDKGEVRGRAYMEEGGVEVVALNEVALEQLRTKLNDVVTNFIDDADAKGIPASAFVDAYSK